MKSRYFFVVVLFTVIAAAVAAQSPMRAGRWDVTTQIQMANMQMPEMKTAQCITPEQLKDPASALQNAASNQKDKQACKVSDYKESGNTVSWKVACSGAQSMSGSGEVTFAGDTYAGVMKMTMQQGEMAMKITGKRLGDCTP